jgi:hypothetical protein
MFIDYLRIRNSVVNVAYIDSAISACNVTYYMLSSLVSMICKWEISAFVLWRDYIINTVLLMVFVYAENWDSNFCTVLWYVSISYVVSTDYSMYIWYWMMWKAYHCIYVLILYVVLLLISGDIM